MFGGTRVQNKRRIFSLLIIALVHIGLLTWSNSVSGDFAPIWIESQSDMPRMATVLVALFIGNVLYRLGQGAFVRGGISPRNVLTDLYQFGLIPGSILCVVLVVLLIVGIPGSGIRARTDEAIIWLISWAIFSAIAYSWTANASVISAISMTLRKHRQTGASHAEQVYPTSILKGLPKERQIVISQLIVRALQLERRSGVILIGIVLMLICAALFIVFAGQITSLDVSGTKLVSLAKSDVQSAEDELTSVSTEMVKTKRLKEQQAAKSAAADSTKTLPPTNVADLSDITPDDVLQIRYDAKKAALTKANELLLKARERQYQDDPTKDQTSGEILLLQTSVTRFGVVLIMVFLVQILVNLYRYNMRLSAFYFGRGDALVLLNNGAEDLNLRTLVELISPDKFDFGKSPRTPAQEATGIIHALAGRFKPTVDSGSDSNPTAKNTDV